MLRLAAVFFVWIASTGRALDDADADYDDYRAANCAIVGASCNALMAQERAAELRHLLTNKNDRTILPPHGRADPREGEFRPDER